MTMSHFSHDTRQARQPKPVYDTGTAAALKIFGTPDDFPLFRGTALQHANGDIYLIVGIVYPRPMGRKPQMQSVWLERKRDKKRIERGVDVIREQLDSQQLQYAEVWNDTRSNCTIETKDDTLIMWTTD